MSTFTAENTSGLTDAQLEIMNKVHADLVAEGMDEKEAADDVSAAWAKDHKTDNDLRAAVDRLVIARHAAE